MEEERIWETIGSSNPFQFLVGPNKREFSVHSALVARQSPVLATLVHGPFREASQGHATLEHVDEQTFASFIQYVYTGDYTPKRLRGPRQAAENAPSKGTEQTKKAEDRRTDTAKKYYLAPDRDPQILKCPQQGYYCACVLREAGLMKKIKSPAKKPLSDPQSLRNKDPATDYTDVFLSHARLYVFADYYQIAELMNRSLSRLVDCLINFELHAERVGDVIELLEYCSRTHSPAPEQLQSLLIWYTMAKAMKMCSNARFQ